MTTRREFLLRSASLAAAAPLWKATNSFAHSLATSPTFDLHSHPGLFVSKGTARYLGDPAVAKTVNEMNAGGLTGAFFGLVADAPIITVTPTGIVPAEGYKPGEAWKEYKRQLAIVKEMITTLPTTSATDSTALMRARESGKVAAYLSCEGGDFLEGKADRVDEMYADGIRSIQIVHYYPNDLGNLQTAAPRHDGLSAAGKEIVKRMNKLRMLIDVAHAAESTVKAITDLTDAPVMLSHSVLQTDPSRPIAKRAITAEHARLVSATGGLIGAWPSGYNTDMADFVDNIRRLADVVGVEHIGLGTDMDGNFKPVISSYLQLNEWKEALAKKGFSAEEVAKIAGGNAERVLKAVL